MSLSDLEATFDATRLAVLAEIEHELVAARRQRDALNNRIRELARKRLRYLDDPRASALASAAVPPKPVALVGFLREHHGEVFKLVEVRRALIARGWMRDEPRDRHALEVAALALAERGEIRRVRRGVYTARADIPTAEAREAA
jgi:hypothetical protein